MSLSKPIILIDFDDTILFTNAIRQCLTLIAILATAQSDPDINKDTEIHLKIKQYDERMCLLISMLLKNGRVFIVSNGSEGWVQHASKKFFPKLFSIFENGINGNKPMIFSAQGKFKSEYPIDWKNATIQWKFSMFKEILFEENCHNVGRHIVSIGDAHTEREALFSVIKNLFPLCSGTSVKMLEKPTLEQLHDQHGFLITHIDQWLGKPCDLKIEALSGSNFSMEPNTHPLVFVPYKNSLLFPDNNGSSDSESDEPSSKKPRVDKS